MSKAFKKISIFIIILLLVLIGGYFGLDKYLDNSNERMVKRQAEERAARENDQLPAISEEEKQAMAEKEKEDIYNACLNQAYKEYQEDLEFDCYVRIDGACQITPEGRNKIELEYEAKKRECADARR